MLIRTKVFGSYCFSLFVVLVFFVLSAHRAKIHVLKPRTNRNREPFAGPGLRHRPHNLFMGCMTIPLLGSL